MMMPDAEMNPRLLRIPLLHYMIRNEGSIISQNAAKNQIISGTYGITRDWEICNTKFLLTKRIWGALLRWARVRTWKWHLNCVRSASDVHCRWSKANFCTVLKWTESCIFIRKMLVSLEILVKMCGTALRNLRWIFRWSEWWMAGW